MRRLTVLLVTALAALGLTACGAEEIEPGRAWIIPNHLGTQPTMDNELSEASGTLAHLAIAVGSSEVITSLSEGEAKMLQVGTEDLQAADGEELLLAEMRSGLIGGDDLGEATAVITAADRSYDVLSSWNPRQDEGAVVVISVPEGEPVTLTVTDEGRGFTVDMRTGETGGDAAGALPDASTPQAGEGQADSVAEYDEQTMAQMMGPQEASYRISLDEATAELRAWVQGLDWAEDGQAFLVIQPIQTFEEGLSGCVAVWDIGTPTFTPDGGDPAPAAANVGTGDEDVIDLDGGLVFQVPAGTESGTLAFEPSVRVMDDCSITEQPGAIELPITLT